MYSKLIAITALTATAMLAPGCGGMSGGAATNAVPTSVWDQTLVTQAAGQLAEGMSGLYGTAIKEPAFAGERTAYGATLDKLRMLEEESKHLHAQLEAGKGREETLHSYERIKELSRDARENETWALLPPSFTASADSAFASLKGLDAYYGAR
jgi:hypothetical protein